MTFRTGGETRTSCCYGDITPKAAPLRSLAILEAFVGQLYLTILVARLVGLQISQGSVGENPGERNKGEPPDKDVSDSEEAP